MRTHSLATSSPPSLIGRTERVRSARWAPSLSWRGRRIPTNRQPSTAEAGPATRSRLAPFLALELTIWAACYGAYLAVRGVSIGSEPEAMRHARDVVDVERALGLFREGGIQSLLAPASRLFSTYYMVGFAPLIALALVWLARRDRTLYRQLRTALLVSLAIATVVFVLFPAAPPRLVGGLGISDTVGLSGHDTGSFMGIRFNPYAAMPSMHVGWSLLVALYCRRAARTRPVRALFSLHPALMALTVVATGNHYLLDGAAGIAVVCIALALLARRPALRAYPRPLPPGPAAYGLAGPWSPVTRSDHERR